MRRVVSVWLPHWATDRLQLGKPSRSPDEAKLDQPVVTARHDGRRRVVAAADAAAQALGLRIGMALAHAAAVAPGLTIVEAEPEADAAALHRLAIWCHRYTPLAAPDPPDGLWLDITGAAHLFGGEAALADSLVARLGRNGFMARAAVADTPGAAHAAARYAPGVLPAGRHMEICAILPIAALRLPSDLVGVLRRLGFDRVADLGRLPRSSLVRRFGPMVVLRLDQLAGQVREPIVPLAPVDALQHRVTFMEPLLTADALSTAITCLVTPLCRQMERAGQGARRLDLLFERVDGAVQAVRIGTAHPSRDIRHLARLLDEHLEKVDPGLGIEAMRLVIPLAEPLHWRQDGDALAAFSADVSTLVDRLSNRLGAERVYRTEPFESDVPERSIRRVPALAPPGGATWSGTPPLRLFNPPCPVEAVSLLPDQPPAFFVWRRHRHRIRHADGPERVYGEWWRRDAEVSAVRDYFRVEDEDGNRFWLFRQGDGMDPATGGLRWFLHGMF